MSHIQKCRIWGTLLVLQEVCVVAGEGFSWFVAALGHYSTAVWGSKRIGSQESQHQEHRCALTPSSCWMCRVAQGTDPAGDFLFSTDREKLKAHFWSLKDCFFHFLTCFFLKNTHYVFPSLLCDDHLFFSGVAIVPVLRTHVILIYWLSMSFLSLNWETEH